MKTRRTNELLLVTGGERRGLLIVCLHVVDMLAPNCVKSESQIWGFTLNSRVSPTHLAAGVISSTATLLSPSHKQWQTECRCYGDQTHCFGGNIVDFTSIRKICMVLPGQDWSSPDTFSYPLESTGSSVWPLFWGEKTKPLKCDTNEVI